MPDAEGLQSDGARAYERAIAGELAPARRFIAARASSSEARAWVSALSVQLWLTLPTAALPDITEMRALQSAPAAARAAALVALADLSLARLLRFEGPAAAPLGAVARNLGAGLGDEADARVALVLAHEALRDGDDETARERATAAADRASNLRLPAVLVESMALRSLACEGDVDQALAVARRASLMGRTEGIPQAEFLAHVALVRARRRAGHPHLALRIVGALARVVTEPWHALLEWERLFAGGVPSLPLDPRVHGAAALAVAAAQTALHAARIADRETTRRELATSEAACEGFVPAARELRDLAACIDLGDAPCSHAAALFRAGERTLTPPSLHGLKLRAAGGDEPESASAYVHVEPGGRATRILHWGARFVEDGVVRIKQSRRTQGRIETLLSVVALASPSGIEEGPCFEATYGFRYVAELHRGVLEVLLHRARAELAGVAEIRRDAGRLSLHPNRPLLIPDPRVSERTQDRILRYLAQQGGASARDAAQGLGVSLRAAQGALKELAETGACRQRRDGRAVEYVVEDTIFSDPTSKIAASALSELRSTHASDG
jgi:hypothetical protein